MHKAIYAFSFMKPFAPSASDVYAHVCMSCVQSAKKALEDFGPVEVASLANRLVWVTPLPCGLSLAQMKLKLFSWSYFYRLPMLQVASLKSWDGKPAGRRGMKAWVCSCRVLLVYSWLWLVTRVCTVGRLPRPHVFPHSRRLSFPSRICCAEIDTDMVNHF